MENGPREGGEGRVLLSTCQRKSVEHRWRSGAGGSDGGGSGIMTASMLETRSKGMGGWPREVYERADIKFHDNSVMKLRVSLEQ